MILSFCVKVMSNIGFYNCKYTQLLPKNKLFF